MCGRDQQAGRGSPPVRWTESQALPAICRFLCPAAGGGAREALFPPTGAPHRPTDAAAPARCLTMSYRLSVPAVAPSLRPARAASRAQAADTLNGVALEGGDVAPPPPPQLLPLPAGRRRGRSSCCTGRRRRCCRGGLTGPAPGSPSPRRLPASFTLYPSSFILHPARCTLNPAHPSSLTPHPSPLTPHPSPLTLHICMATADSVGIDNGIMDGGVDTDGASGGGIDRPPPAPTRLAPDSADSGGRSRANAGERGRRHRASKGQWGTRAKEEEAGRPPRRDAARARRTPSLP
eukprot:gene6157-biopygen214